MGNEGAGTAGASAQREYERRRANDGAKLRAEWGRFGGIAVALSSEKQSTRAWASGANGERIVGARLDSMASETVRVLHDRRIPGSRANIDHVVVTPAGVWVVDAKRYKDQRPALVVEGGILRPRVEKLVVGRRDQTKLVEGVLGQVARVSSVVGDEVPVRGMLCFVEADWPLIGGSFAVRGVDVVWPKKMVAAIGGVAGVGVDVAGVYAALELTFRPA